jgi:hypothetical protein
MATDRPTEAPPADSCPQPEPQGPDDHRSRAETYADLRAADQRTADRSRDLRAGGERAAGSVSPADQRAADPAPLAGDAPHTTADGGWSWKSLRLNRADNQVADQQLAARRQAEGRHPDGTYDDRGLTPALRRVEGQLDHGTLIPDTEKFALKSPDRFKEKLAKLTARYPERGSEQLASAIHDGIRYTFIFDSPYYVAGVSAAEHKLAAEGYRLQLRKPSWDDPDYKGVNCRWLDPGTGARFEVQFHTPESWEAKQLTHGVYEKLADPRITPEQRSQLDNEQRKVTARIPIPEGAAGIAHYRAEDANE